LPQDEVDTCTGSKQLHYNEVTIKKLPQLSTMLEISGVWENGDN